MATMEAGLSEAAVIERSCPCVTCGYDLRTREVGTSCPECDTPARFTFVHQANLLAGADRGSLRALTSGVVWLALALIWPAVFVFVPLPEAGSQGWWSGNRKQLAVVLPPAIFALIGCWRLGARVRPAAVPEDDDQPVTRWALRAMAVAWFVPLLETAGPWATVERERSWYDPLVRVACWIGVPATFLVYRRLKFVARRVPSKVLAAQCGLVGSQLPLASILVVMFLWNHGERDKEAFAYAVSAPLPGVGAPWPIVARADQLEWVRWEYLLSEPEHFTVLWPVLFSLWALVLMVEFAVVLVRVRRRGGELAAYCREVLAARERVGNG